MSLRRLLTFPGFIPILVVLLVSVIETAGLGTWLDLTNINYYIAGTVLFVALFVEHIISQLDHTRRGLSSREFGQIVGFSFLETTIWIVWLVLIPISPILAASFFLVSLFIEHQITDNVKKGLRFFHFSRVTSLVFIGLAIVTVIEVVSASIWISTGLLAVMLLGNTVEHYIARNVGKIEE